MKTLKKLNLTKTFIANLGDNEMHNLRGGEDGITVNTVNTNSCYSKSGGCEPVTKGANCKTLSESGCMQTLPPLFPITTSNPSAFEGELF